MLQVNIMMDANLVLQIAQATAKMNLQGGGISELAPEILTFLGCPSCVEDGTGIHWGNPGNPQRWWVFSMLATWEVLVCPINYRSPFSERFAYQDSFSRTTFSSCSKGRQERRTCPGESSNPPFCHELIRDKSVQLSAHVHIWAKTQVMWWTLRSFWFQSDQRTAAWWKSHGLKGCVWCFGMFWWISWVKASAAKRLPNAALSSIVAIETNKN